jgi:predicted RecA/RadA family phage recombinase
MSNNFVQKGDAVDFVVPTGGCTAGLPVKIGSMILVASVTAAVGETVAGYRTGVFDLTAEGAASGQAMTFGDLVYWDNTNKRVTVTSTGNTKIGVFASTTDKTTTATTARVCLVPTV